MADNALPKTLTVTQALHRITNGWGRDESTAKAAFRAAGGRTRAARSIVRPARLKGR